MNRRLSRLLQHAAASLLALTTGSFLLLQPLSASAEQASQRIPPIPQAAQRGVLVVTLPPEVLLDGQAARLSPGARIHGRNNLLLMSGALVDQKLTVSYVRDTLGLIHEVWILTEAEAAAVAHSRP